MGEGDRWGEECMSIGAEASTRLKEVRRQGKSGSVITTAAIRGAARESEVGELVASLEKGEVLLALKMGEDVFEERPLRERARMLISKLARTSQAPTPFGAALRAHRGIVEFLVGKGERRREAIFEYGNTMEFLQSHHDGARERLAASVARDGRSAAGMLLGGFAKLST